MIEKAMIKLVKTKPFFANLLMNMNRHFTTEIPTLGVNVTDSVNLYVNPHFWASLNLDQQTDILCHEVYHVLNNHFTRFKEMEPTIFEDLTDKSGMTPGDIVVKRIVDGGKAKTCNMAADYAINEYLPNLPKKFNLFDQEGNVIKGEDGKPLEATPCLVSKHKDWERYKHMEYYYELMKQEQQKKKQKGQGQGGGQGEGDGDGEGGPGECPIDDHGIWNEGNQDSEYVLEKIKQTVNKAAQATGAGDMPSDVKSLIDKLNYKPRDWRSDLQRFVARQTEMLIESSRKVRNRRYGTMYPGNKVYPTLTLAACVDTSGSMSDEALNQIACELKRIADSGVTIWVIEADCTVQNVWLFDAKKLKDFKGRGGTAYSPALEHAEKELEVDGIIYFGDMDSADRPKKPRVPVLWAIVNSQQEPPAKWGYKTYVKIAKKSG